MKLKKLLKADWHYPENKPMVVEEEMSQELKQMYPDGFVLVKFKPLEKILIENPDYFFDHYGNLVTKHGHLAPAHFSDLGHEYHVKVGCGFSMQESDWLKETP